MSGKQQTTRLVLDRCYELGFALAGIAAAEPTRYEPQLRQWLTQGKHGEMQYLAQHTPQRIDPRNKWFSWLAANYSKGSRQVRLLLR